MNQHIVAARSPNPATSGGRIAGLALVLVSGVALVAEGTNFRGFFLTPADFAQTPGRVTVSRLRAFRQKPSRARYGYDIAYRYVVAGRVYTSHVVSFGRRTTPDRGFAEGYARRYPVGRLVTVWYRPREPAFAVLEPSNKDGTLTSLAVTAVLLLGALGLLFGPRRHRS